MDGDDRLTWSNLYRILAKTAYLVAGIYIAIAFLDAIVLVLLLGLLAVIISMALNPPITWLERKRVNRALSTAIVLLGVVMVLGALAWLVVPRLVKQATALASSLPGYAQSVSSRMSHALEPYPAVRNRLKLDQRMTRTLVSSGWAVARRIGRYSLSALAALIMGLVLVSIVIYILANPRPLIRGVLEALPLQLREPVSRALTRSSQVVSGWVLSNVIVGGVEAVAATVFLSVIGVPGALVWGVVTFFAELVPRLGLYLMMIPPAIVAFAVSPLTALWVVLFYLVLSELTSDFLSPPIRGSQMNLHPVSVILAILVMATIFGFLGALIATPVTGFAKAFYDELYLSRQPKDDRLDGWTNKILAWWARETGGG